MQRLFARSSVGLLAVALAIAGCAGSGTPSSVAGSVARSAAPIASNEDGASAGNSQTGGGPSPAGAGSGGSVEDGLGHPVSVCDVLPAATVASVTGEPLTVATEDDTTDYKIYACTYTSANGTSEVRVSVLALDAAAGFDGALQAAGSGAKEISGLGDKAFSSVLGVKALFGNVSITVSNVRSDDAAATLIKTLQPKL